MSEGANPFGLPAAIAPPAADSVTPGTVWLVIVEKLAAEVCIISAVKLPLLLESNKSFDATRVASTFLLHVQIRAWVCLRRLV